MLTFLYDSTLESNGLSCVFSCSRDLFDETTVSIISRRFKHLFGQIFSLEQTCSRINTCLMLISKLDLILPEEKEEMEDIVFCRQSHIVNEGMFIH